MEASKEYYSPMPKVVQYADQILKGTITWNSLKGQIPETWIKEVKKVLESRGYLIVEDSPEMYSERANESELKPEEIKNQLELAQNQFSNETSNLLETAKDIGIKLPESLIEEVDQEIQFSEKMKNLKQYITEASTIKLF